MICHFSFDEINRSLVGHHVEETVASEQDEFVFVGYVYYFDLVAAHSKVFEFNFVVVINGFH